MGGGRQRGGGAQGVSGEEGREGDSRQTGVVIRKYPRKGVGREWGGGGGGAVG